jgi:hypothetical protein
MGGILGHYPEDMRKWWMFEMKMLRRIYGPSKYRDQWRCRFNGELYSLFKGHRLSV